MRRRRACAGWSWISAAKAPRRGPRRVAAGPRPRPSSQRCGLPDPGVLCDARAPRRAARDRPGPAAPSSKGPANPMSKTGRHAIVADTVFDGTALHRFCAVIIEGAQIVGLAARGDLPAAMPRRDLPEGVWLAPGFIDVQVNGGGDLLFNDTPTPEGIAAIVAAHRQFGTTGLLPPPLSDSAAKMRQASAAVNAPSRRSPSLLGLPFL